MSRFGLKDVRVNFDDFAAYAYCEHGLNETLWDNIDDLMVSVFSGGKPPKDSIITKITLQKVSIGTYVAMCVVSTLGLKLTAFFTLFNIFNRKKR